VQCERRVVDGAMIIVVNLILTIIAVVVAIVITIFVMIVIIVFKNLVIETHHQNHHFPFILQTQCHLNLFSSSNQLVLASKTLGACRRT
jgi:hypothetical protein